MLKELVDRLLEVGRSERSVVPVYETPFEKVVLVEGSRETVPRHFSRVHYFNGLESLVAWLNDPNFVESDDLEYPAAATRPREADLGGAVFVGFATNCPVILGVPFYGSPRELSCRMDLELSEEFQALLEFSQGMGPVELRKELVTRLDGCFDGLLLRAVQEIRVSKEGMSHLKIDQLGVTSEKGESAIRVTYPHAENGGGVPFTLPSDWLWRGRLWDEFDREVEIPCRLEIQAGEGLRYIMHPSRVDTHVRLAREALVAQLRGQLAPRYRVYDGSF